MDRQETYQMASFDLSVQIRLLLIRYYEQLLQYRERLKMDNGDLLFLHDDLDSSDPLILHLHLSADGGQLFRYKKQLFGQCMLLFWTFHLT